MPYQRLACRICANLFLWSFGSETCSKDCRLEEARRNAIRGFKKKQAKKRQRWESKKQRRAKKLGHSYVSAFKNSDSFYASAEWRTLRFKALMKFGRKCYCCGATPPAVVIHVDHIKPRSTHPHLELSFDNLQILCSDCNVGKSNLFEIDFRPGQPGKVFDERDDV